MSFFDCFNLGRGFQRHFRIEAAASDTVRNEIFRVRHEVYCEELGYEPQRPDRLEIDAFDAHSLHCLLRTQGDAAAPVGCVRLVLTDPNDRSALLPFERTCADALDRSLCDPSRLPRERIAEVSRLAVRSQFRRRRGESASTLPLSEDDFGTKTQPRFPYIPIGLYLGAIALAQRQGVEKIFVLTEPRLASHFAKLGVEITQIGSPVEHRGIRIPSMMDVQAITRDLRMIFRPIWRVIKAEVDASIDGTPTSSSKILREFGKPPRLAYPVTPFDTYSRLDYI